jgi:hypothetical protein
MNDFTINDIEDFLEILREGVPDAVNVFTMGNCATVVLLLAKAFPGGEVYHDTGHLYYVYNKLAYDIQGNVEISDSAERVRDLGVIQIRQLLKNNYKP